MTIREQYLALESKSLSTQTIEEVKSLRDCCIKEQNYEFYYLCQLKLIDFYIELNLFDEGLLIAHQDVPNIDATVFRLIYVSYLDRLIYLYIQKRNFRIAHRYVYEKRTYIDQSNRDQVNRWYLEMATIDAEMNQKTKALQHLQAIVENLPNEEILSHALSNMTKLYIDEGMVTEAEKTLSRCLEVTFDAEGRLYCDYLYALICMLREKWQDAKHLFHDIFVDGIQPQYLSIALDYLNLLVKHKDLDDATRLISQLQPLIETTKDQEAKKVFYWLSLQAMQERNHDVAGSIMVDKLRRLDEKEQSEAALFLSEALEDEKKTVLDEHINQLNERVERLVHLNPFHHDQTLRDLLMDFSMKLGTILDCDEIHFAEYQRLVATIPTKKIKTYYYKSKRLYEKTITFDDLKNTVIETLLINHQEVFLDLNHYSVPLINIGTGKSYQEQGLSSLFALPLDEEESMFFSVIFAAKYTDLGTADHRLLLRTAAKLLEARVRLFYHTQRERFLTFQQDLIKDKTKSFINIHHADGMILDSSLVQHCEFKSATMNRADYAALMKEKEQSSYMAFALDLKQTLSYTLSMGEITKVMSEFIYPVSGEEGLAIGLVMEQDQDLEQETKFEEAITSVKEKTKSVEYKFSFIRLKATIKEYQVLEEHFGVPIYYVGQDQYVIILENETNQKTLERLMKGYENRFSVIRFPRDMINIHDIMTYSKISLEEHIPFFTDEAYQSYLKKVHIQQLVTSALKSPLDCWYHEVTLHQAVVGLEAHPRINGVLEKELVRSYLDASLRKTYDEWVLEGLIKKPSQHQLYCYASIAVIQSDFIMRSGTPLSYLHLMIDEPHDQLLELINKLNIRHISVLLHQRLLDQLSSYDVQKLEIEGIIIDTGLEKEKRAYLLDLSRQMEWNIYTTYQYPDYENCLIRSAHLIKE